VSYLWAAKSSAGLAPNEREVLEYVPSHFKRVLHIRPKMSCRACETIVQAPMPSLPIEKGRPGPALLAHVLVSKFGDHQPLHRQAEIFARSGVDVDRSTMAGWVGQMAALLAPLGDALLGMCAPAAWFTLMTRRFPCSIPGAARPRPVALWVAVRDERPFGSTVPPAAFYI